MKEMLQFRRLGRNFGVVTVMGLTPEEKSEIEENIRKKRPLPLIFDKSLESNLMFVLLPEEDKARIRAATSADEKRRLLDEAVDRFIEEGERETKQAKKEAKGKA